MGFEPQLLPEEVELAFEGRYKSVAKLAAGGQGLVLRAQEPHCESSVAVKIYFPGSHPERTRREIAALGRIQSPHLVRLQEAGMVRIRGEECFFVVTDFIHGKSLADVLHDGPIDWRTTLTVGEHVARAIELIWSERIVHRDVKPPNIMCSSDASFVLIDLGVARHLSLGSLTTMGKTWGSEGYMSPEHAKAARQLSCKSDVFSLGIVLQQCLAGKHPTGFDQMRLMFGSVRTESIRAHLPLEFAAIINRMVSVTPEVRPRPTELIEVFQKLSRSI